MKSYRFFYMGILSHFITVFIYNYVFKEENDKYTLKVTVIPVGKGGRM